MQSIILFVLIILLTLMFGGTGYCIAYAITGIVAFVVIDKGRTAGLLFRSARSQVHSPFTTGYVKYGLLVGFGSLASQLALTTDTLMVGNLISDPQELAFYRVAALIAFNLLFIPKVIITTDFVVLAENRLDAAYLKRYIFDYLKSVGVISTISILGSVAISEYLLAFAFGEPYRASAASYNYLAIGVIGAFLLRVPVSNILNAVGRAQWNIYSSIGLVVVNIPLTYWLVRLYGIEGAAISTSLVWWLSGLVSIVLYWMHIARIQEPGEL